MNQDQFIERLEQLYKENVEISKKKNADYADYDNPFKNFQACELYGVPMYQGLLVRMSDKMTRVSNLLKREAEVSDESIKDTLQDLANYSMILRIIIENETHH